VEICVSGWYYDPALMAQLPAVAETYPVTVLVARKRAQEISEIIRERVKETDSFRHWVVPYCSQEWGNYDWYIKNCWTHDDVLFMHDDIRVSDVAAFDRVAKLCCDQAFIFQGEAEGVANQNFHGRMIFCSARFVDFMLRWTCTCRQARDHEDAHHNVGKVLPGTGPHRGFWHDPWNDGHVSGKPAAGVRHYNDGIYHFAGFCKRFKQKAEGAEGFVSDVKAYFPEFEHAKRGLYMSDRTEAG
jgi:hypothetical protein